MRPVLVSTALLAAVLVAGEAAAQVPLNRPSSPDPLPPMPSPQPLRGTPPNVGATSSSQYAVTPPPPSVATPSTTQPGPGTPPDVRAVGPARPTDAQPPVQPLIGPAPATASSPSLAAEEPAPTGRRRRLWGEGTTMIRRDTRIGVYLAPTFAVTQINRAPGLLLGADFAVLIGERFAVGAAGEALATPLAVQRSDGRTFNLRAHWFGATLAVALLRFKFFSVGVGALIGGGRVCLNDERLDRCVNRAAMFVAEPELGLSFAITKIFRVVLSGGYRVVVTQAWSGPPNPELRGLTGTLALRLGKF